MAEAYLILHPKESENAQRSPPCGARQLVPRQIHYRWPPGGRREVDLKWPRPAQRSIQPDISASQWGTSRANSFPLPEQREIVRRVSALFALADGIEAKLATGRKRVDALTQAVLAKAFRGELVPTEAGLARAEGRTYEPASALLERVRAERDATAKPVRRRKG